MIQPNEPIATVISEQLGQTIYNGLDMRTHMAIEFAKALLSNSTIVYEHDTSTQIWVAQHAIHQADELIKQLNQTL